MEETSCEVICGAPMTLNVKGQVKVVKMKAPTGSGTIISNGHRQVRFESNALGTTRCEVVSVVI